MGVDVHSSSRVVSEAGWRAMGSDVHVIAVGSESATYVEVANAHLELLESLWSRFLPHSEINQLNSAGGTPVSCSGPTLDLVDHMVRGWQLTEGAFDPTMLDTIVSLGYPTPCPLSHPVASERDEIRFRSHPEDIAVDREHRTITLPLGTNVDPGGVGKGLAADMIVSAVRAAGAVGALASVGGDLAVDGVPPTGDAWQIDIEAYPGAARETVRLLSGGIATSTTRLRTWTQDGHARHHLIDPQTQLPAETAVTGCTVIAGSAATAEVFTKPAFVVGCDTAIEMYQRVGLAAWIVSDRSSRHSDAWSQFSRKEASP